MSNIPVIFRFLKDLTANNNREWFNEHREEYEMCLYAFYGLPCGNAFFIYDVKKFHGVMAPLCFFVVFLSKI